MQEIAATMQQMTTDFQTMQQQLAQAQLEARTAEEAVTEAKEKAALMKGSGKGATHTSANVDTRTLGRPDHFDGNERDWGDWSVVLRAYCTLVNATLQKLMDDAENPDVPDVDLKHDDTFEDDDKMACESLFHMLVLLVRHEALNIVTNTGTTERSLEATLGLEPPQDNEARCENCLAEDVAIAGKCSLCYSNVCFRCACEDGCRFLEGDFHCTWCCPGNQYASAKAQCRTPGGGKAGKSDKGDKGGKGKGKLAAIEDDEDKPVGLECKTDIDGIQYLAPLELAITEDSTSSSSSDRIVKVGVDSCAAVSAMPAAWFRDYPITTDERTGATYRVANAQRVTDKGASIIKARISGSDVVKDACFRRADISRALLSVAAMVDAGNVVVFQTANGEDASFHRDNETGDKVDLIRSNGIYELELEVLPFTGQSPGS